MCLLPAEAAASWVVLVAAVGMWANGSHGSVSVSLIIITKSSVSGRICIFTIKFNICQTLKRSLAGCSWNLNQPLRNGFKDVLAVQTHLWKLKVVVYSASLRTFYAKEEEDEEGQQ